MLFCEQLILTAFATKCKLGVVCMMLSAVHDCLVQGKQLEQGKCLVLQQLSPLPFESDLKAEPGIENKGEKIATLATFLLKSSRGRPTF